MPSTTKTAPQRPRSDRMHDIEHKHFGRCLDQLWGAGRRTLVELMEYPKGKCNVVLLKQFEHGAPTSGSGKPWPDLISAYVYVPLPGNDMTWDGLDDSLTQYEAKVGP